MRSKTVEVKVLMTINEDTGKDLPLTRNGIDALAHAMVYDALQHTEDERGFYSGPLDTSTISTSWSIPKAECGLAELDNQIDQGRMGRFKSCAHQHDRT